MLCDRKASCTHQLVMLQEPVFLPAYGSIGVDRANPSHYPALVSEQKAVVWLGAAPRLPERLRPGLRGALAGQVFGQKATEFGQVFVPDRQQGGERHGNGSFGWSSNIIGSSPFRYTVCQSSPRIPTAIADSKRRARARMGGRSHGVDELNATRRSRIFPRRPWQAGHRSSRRRLYAFGHLIRLTEQLILDQFTRGLVSGTTHTCLGQELTAMAVVRALDHPDDVVLSNHRNHGHFLTYSGRFPRPRRRDHGARGGRVRRQRRQPAPGLPPLPQQRRAGRHDGHRRRPRARAQAARRAAASSSPSSATARSARASLYEEPEPGVGVECAAAVRRREQRHRADDRQPRHHRRRHRRARRGVRPAHVASCRRRPGLLPQGRGASCDGARDRPARLPGDRHAAAWDRTARATICASATRSTSIRPAIRSLRWGDPAARSRASHRRAQSASSSRRPARPPNASPEATLDDTADAHLHRARRAAPGAALSARSRPADNVRQALNAALRHLLETDAAKRCCSAKTCTTPTAARSRSRTGLSTDFPGRVISTPISEAGIAGAAIGLALAGFLPIMEVMFADFLTLAWTSSTTTR